MDARLAGEIETDGGRGDVADREPGERRLVELESAKVVREHDQAAGRQAFAAQVEQPDVIALHVEIRGALGIGERRWIDEDQIMASGIALQELERIGAD